jgi:hypothetical protein
VTGNTPALKKRLYAKVYYTKHLAEMPGVMQQPVFDSHVSHQLLVLVAEVSKVGQLPVEGTVRVARECGLKQLLYIVLM